MATGKNFEGEIDSPTFEQLMKPKKSRTTNHKIEAFKRAEKTKFEDLRNLLGLEIDLFQILSHSHSPMEEEIIKLHTEIEERVNTYEKVNRKLGWQVEDISEQVDEQIAKRDSIISKYDNIFANMNRKLTEMELIKKQTTKTKEDIMKEKKQVMKGKIRSSSQEGIDYMQKNCETINELVSSGAAYIDTVKTMHMKKVEGIKIAENEYSNRQFRENYEHKKNMASIRQKGNQMIEEFWDQEYNCEVLGPSIYKNKTKREIKDFIVKDLDNK